MFDGKLTVTVDGEETCGESFCDLAALNSLLNRYAIGRRVVVTIEAAGAEEILEGEA